MGEYHEQASLCYVACVCIGERAQKVLFAHGEDAHWKKEARHVCWAVERSFVVVDRLLGG